MKMLFGAVTAAMLFALAPAMADDPITLRISHQFPADHIVTTSGIDVFMQNVERLVPGKVKFEHFPANQLAKAAAQFDAARNKITDIGIHNAAYTPEKLPLTTFLELPNLFTFAESLQAQRAYTKLSRNELNAEEYERQGVYPIWGFLVPPFQFMLSDPAPITAISQFDGKKFRVPGAGAELVLQSLGGVGVRIPSADSYLALQRGTVDGIIISTQATWAYKLEEVLGAYSTNASMGSVGFNAFLGLDTWNDLPEDVQAAMKRAGEIAGDNLILTYMKNEFESNAELAKIGKTVFQLPDDVLGEMNKRFEGVRANWLSKMESRDLNGQAVLDRFREYVTAE